MALRKTCPIPEKMEDAFLVCIALESNWKYLDCKIKAVAATGALNCSKVYENTTLQLTGHNKPYIVLSAKLLIKKNLLVASMGLIFYHSYQVNLCYSYWLYFYC